MLINSLSHQIGKKRGRGMIIDKVDVIGQFGKEGT
jgi:hypothetical protein